MVLPSRPQDHGPPVSGDTPPASHLPRKALLPDLGRLLPRSRRRGLEGVGATPRPSTNHSKPRSKSCISIESPSSVLRVSSPKHLPPARAKNLLVFRWQQPGATSRIRSGRRRRNGTTAFYTAQLPTLPPALPKGSHLFIEGELIYREFERTVESEAGTIEVQWPVTEIVVESIETLDRKTKDSTETEGAALAAPSVPRHRSEM